ncbi:hypothetical protein HW452_16785 [Halomonas aquamarina]|uniref:Uncharacterized protein n=1 Tax=Vreelandella aquamarina TaxID=77097 RepID=A0ACC5VZ81_9GAMM|nr:hypothetical protein [Halomonas aquamarina]MBZ5489178.1 hypothetical protein [Halomonas aquamarina]
MSKAIIKAFEERQRQINEEGFDAVRDAQYDDGELALAAAGYASHVSFQQRYPSHQDAVSPGVWPWSPEWWKPSADAKRNIIKAMALLAAEYDRIERAETAASGAQQNTKTVWSNNDEEFNYDDLYELISDSERQAGDTVYAGEAVMLPPSAFAVRTALSVIDGLQDEAHNFADEASEGFADCSQPQIDLLQGLIDAWADTTLTVDFYGVTSIQQHTVTAEDVEASQ